MATASLENWLSRELGKLDIDASPDVVSYILSMEEFADVKEYMTAILDSKDPHVQKFLTELMTRWRSCKAPGLPSTVKVYQKDTEESYVATKDKAQKEKPQKKGKKPGQTLVSDSSSNGSAALSLHNGSASLPEETVPSVPHDDEGSTSAKKKSKFIPLWSQEGQARTAVRLPGRHPCECQASKHKLVGNCLRCGRVVCAQEGSGPCFFCGSLVCTAEERDVVERGSHKGEKLRQFLMKGGAIPKTSESDLVLPPNSKSRDSLDKAIKNRDRLLEYDQNSTRRTKVIDDEADYFSVDTNKWLTKEQRQALKQREEELRSKRFGSRRDRKVTLDFAGRRVVEEDNEAAKQLYNENDDVVQQVYFGKKSEEAVDFDSSEGFVNPTISIDPPQFEPSEVSYSEKAARPRQGEGSKSKTGRGEQVQDSEKAARPRQGEGSKSKKGQMRIQDRELMEMSDEGMCLSMHQPWASLLIKGIKVHEGRTWYTPHRGRLWIAATAKSPSPQEIEEQEDFHRHRSSGARLEFPSSYPVGCLLGCVDLVDCLAQDDYRLQFPDGESASPFVFICVNPRELVVKFPIKGKHKIYKLESHIHQAAKKGIR